MSEPSYVEDMSYQATHGRSCPKSAIPLLPEKIPCRAEDCRARGPACFNSAVLSCGISTRVEMMPIQEITRLLDSRKYRELPPGKKTVFIFEKMHGARVAEAELALYPTSDGLARLINLRQDEMHGRVICRL